MFKKLLIGLFMIFASCTSVSPQNSSSTFAVSKSSDAVSFDEHTAYKSVVRIYAVTNDGGELSGTGFAIDKDYIITAGHVCSGILGYQEKGIAKKDIYMYFYGPDDETLLTATGLKIINIDRVNDVCVMKKKSHGILPVKFANFDNVRVHSKTYIVGAPLGIPFCTFEGEVIVKDMDFGLYAKHKMVVSSAAAPGNSGSPVFDISGRVVGMLVMGDQNFDHISICTTTPIVQRFLKVCGIR